MNIALDYDGTYTADKDFWNNFIESANAKGHSVTIVTLRNGFIDRSNELWDLAKICPIVYCDGKAKLDVVEDQKLHIDIWIDDLPRSILHGSSLSPEELADWRKNHTD